MTTRPNYEDILAKLIADGALFFVSHSGGKDSQAMYAIVCNVVPADQIIVVHADLGEVEWPGVQDHIRANTHHPVNVVRAGKTLLEMVERRHESRPEVPSWPSPGTRQCTSDLKRGPIQKFIRHAMKERGATLAVNCVGLRAAESSSRAKRDPWTLNKALSKAGRAVYDWLPIHEFPDSHVFDTIKRAGQKPFWAYAAGNKRLSCMFCIMGCQSDLENAARHNPELAEKYIALEQKTGYSMFHGESLAEKLAKRSNAAGQLKLI